MYTKPLGNLIRRHNMQYHGYADDTQGYITIKPNVDWRTTSSTIEACVEDVGAWMSGNMLKLNHSKTKLIIFRPKHRPTPTADLSITIGNSTVSSARHVKNLGVIQDSCLTMEQQTNAITKACYFQIGKIRRFITTDACKTLVHATITSRLDYANVLLYGLPQSLLAKLQRVQNSAARLISRSRKRDHITPVLRELHWLPVEYRPRYKVLIYTYQALLGTAPSYICDLVEKHQPTRPLRSASKLQVTVPKARTVTYGDRSFRCAAATLWNDLPEYIKKADSLAQFKRLLKTHLFQQAYPV